MIWFVKSFIKFCKSFINLIKLVNELNELYRHAARRGLDIRVHPKGLTIRSETESRVV